MAHVQAKKGKRVVTIPSPFNVDVTDDGKVNVDISHPAVASLIASGDLVVLDAAPADPPTGSPGSEATSGAFGAEGFTIESAGGTVLRITATDDGKLDATPE